MVRTFWGGESPKSNCEREHPFGASLGDDDGSASYSVGWRIEGTNPRQKFHSPSGLVSPGHLTRAPPAAARHERRNSVPGLWIGDGRPRGAVTGHTPVSPAAFLAPAR